MRNPKGERKQNAQRRSALSDNSSWSVSKPERRSAFARRTSVREGRHEKIGVLAWRSSENRMSWRYRLRRTRLTG